MIARGLRLLAPLLLSACPALADVPPLAPGSTHRIVFQDVDGDDLATSDGHVTIVTVVTRANEEKARAVADLVPDRYLGDTHYRYVTVVNFQRKLAAPFQGLTLVVIRHRLDAEAKELKAGYEAKKIAHDPRHDLYVVADFDGGAVGQLGLPVEGGEVAVFVFNGQGKLIARWTDVPPGDSLPKAIAAAAE